MFILVYLKQDVITCQEWDQEDCPFCTPGALSAKAAGTGGGGFDAGKTIEVA